MQLTIKCFISAIIITLLTACAEPVVFGVPESVWNCLTTVQQEAVIESYNQAKIHDPNKCCLVGDAQKNVYRCRGYRTCFRTLPYDRYAEHPAAKRVYP